VSDKPIMTLENVSFAYNGKSVLSDVSLCIHEKDAVCIVGPNGGGKTTLLKLFLGLLNPTSGKITVFGDTPQNSRNRIGYMPQHLYYDQAFPASVMDVVLMGRIGSKLLGFYSRRDKDVAMSVLTEMNIADLYNRSFSELSGGQRQRVLIARALACEPELLLLDEPTANVDPAIESQFYEILKELTQKITVMTVSHDLGFVAQSMTRVLCVNQYVKIHPTSEITGEVISDIYGGDIKMIRHDHHCSQEGHCHD
jgi:zinc transport system ATP-binding protein